LNYLITGASGFVAGHLIEAIFKAETNPIVTSVDRIEPDYFFLEHDKRQLINFFKSELMNKADIEKILEEARPDVVVHLASFSSVRNSWIHPITSFNNNLNIFFNLLESVKYVNSKIRILSVGSSEQYGIVPADRMPIKENEPLNPISPYAVARVAQENLAKVYINAFKLDIVITRSFNHFGSRQSEAFVLSHLAKQIAEIKTGRRRPVIEVGDTDIIRDFTDVRDIVMTYRSLIENGVSGEIYNVCSGIGRSIKDCLHKLIELSEIQCETSKDENLLRPLDNPVIIGDNTKLKNNIGWFPHIPFETALHDLYKFWLSKYD
jgi:GDP-4-dehydro-6-deoxy-D-mannose reductase